MKREIEINRAVNSYISIYFGSYIRDVERAFRNGIEWADENPKNIWHDADDMPNNHSYIMFFVDRYTIKTDYIPACLNHCQLNKSNWSEFVKKVNMTKWVYVSDLLPKGGEE